MIDWSILQGVATLAIAAAAFYYARKKDTSEASANLTELLVEFRTLRRDIGELKGDVQAVRTDLRTDHDKIVSMERDIKAMWRHIDNMKGADNEA